MKQDKTVIWACLCMCVYDYSESDSLKRTNSNQFRTLLNIQSNMGLKYIRLKLNPNYRISQCQLQCAFNISSKICCCCRRRRHFFVHFLLFSFCFLGKQQKIYT